MPSKSASKGKRLEYEIVDKLNAIFQSTEFARVPNSGGYMGGRNFAKKQGIAEHARQALASDLIVPTWFKFSVECKNYADDPKYHKIIWTTDTTLEMWLAQAETDATNKGVYPMLVFRTTRKGTYVALPRELFQDIHMDYYLNYKNYYIIGWDVYESLALPLKINAEQLLQSGENQHANP